MCNDCKRIFRRQAPDRCGAVSCRCDQSVRSNDEVRGLQKCDVRIVLIEASEGSGDLLCVEPISNREGDVQLVDRFARIPKIVDGSGIDVNLLRGERGKRGFEVS